MASSAEWRSIEFPPHERVLQDKCAEEMCTVFERLLRKNIISKQSDQFFPALESRSLDELALSGHKNSRKTKTALQQEELELHTKLLDQSYFKSNGAVISLDETLFKQSNELLSNSDAYLAKTSELRDIQKRYLAPNVNKKLEKVYTGEWAKEQKEKSKTAGKGWFNMPEAVLTPEVKQELLAHKLKHTLAGGVKSASKAEQDLEANPPKFFQIGKIIDAPHEFYSSHVPKRNQKRTFLDDIIHEQDTSGYVNDRYKQVQKGLDTTQKRKKRKMAK